MSDKTGLCPFQVVVFGWHVDWCRPRAYGLAGGLYGLDFGRFELRFRWPGVAFSNAIVTV